MKTIMFTLVLLASSIVLGQTPYQKAMKNALDRWNQTESIEEFTAIANQFDRIAEKDSTAWEPKYYAILLRSIQGFYLPKEIAINAMDEVEEDYNKLLLLEDNSEIKILKGLFETVKISKDPMVYGRTLSASISKTYAEALEQNPNNPRAIYNLAQYEMGGAKYWGKDPKDSCPKVEKAIELFKAEKNAKRQGFEPRWGLEEAQKLWDTTCK
ncbi:MAG: hypothetical protein ACR2MS_12390 [Weeksellaceae bacterium]